MRGQSVSAVAVLGCSTASQQSMQDAGIYICLNLEVLTGPQRVPITVPAEVAYMRRLIASLI